MTGYV